MLKEIKEVDKEKGVIRVTSSDERFYARPSKNKETGLPEYEYVPSVTFITSFYPKGEHFIHWVAQKGIEEAMRIRDKSGERGSIVHQAIESLLNGDEIKIDSNFINKETGQKQEITSEEYGCVMDFKNWYDVTQPETIFTEQVIFGDGYAGTVDYLCRIKGEVYIVDFKTSSSIWPSHKLQLSAYGHAEYDLKKLGITEKEWKERKLAILQVGYKRTKLGYKFTEVDDNYDLFLSTKEIWFNEMNDKQPLQREYPLSIKLKVNKNKQ